MQHLGHARISISCDSRLSLHAHQELKKNIFSLLINTDIPQLISQLPVYVKKIEVCSAVCKKKFFISVWQPIAKINNDSVLLENGSVVDCSLYQDVMQEDLFSLMVDKNIAVRDGPCIAQWLLEQERITSPYTIKWRDKNDICLFDSDIKGHIHITHQSLIHKIARLKVDGLIVQEIENKKRVPICIDMRFENMIISKSGGVC